MMVFFLTEFLEALVVFVVPGALDLAPVPERYGLDNRVLEVDDFIGRHEEPERIRVRDFPRRIT